MPKPLSKQAKNMFASLIDYFEQERDHGGPLIPVTSVRERVAAALKVNLSTVTSVWQAVKQNQSLNSPKRKRSRSKPITMLDDGSQVAIRNTIYQMYEHNEHITLNSLWDKVHEPNIFSGCKRSLCTVLKTLGFKWKKDEPRRGLMEMPHVVVMQRLTFLRRYMQYKQENLYNFVYLDETWIFQNGTISRSWQDENVRSVKSTKVDGKRFVTCNIVSSS
ncbi:retrotransposon gag protein [Holotrichia oblita]|uniref:Retrotransposon gag protein n=1 Tax=Holotrichia oblita TaxID=644536 RepID=A0ACB9SLF1_HOLOL|nr:retrotransposon gag protein [Holotrichia oblita]